MHEPQQALVSGKGGLEDIQNIVETAQKHLTPGGWLLVEHGWQQAAQVRSLLKGVGYSQVETKLDLAGIERCSGGQK
jgi:release factor glutamine methyltransferase